MTSQTSNRGQLPWTLDAPSVEECCDSPVYTALSPGLDNITLLSCAKALESVKESQVCTKVQESEGEVDRVRKGVVTLAFNGI